MRNSSTIWVWHGWSCRRGNGTKPTQNGERLRVRQRYDAIHKATPQETISEDEAWERAIEQSKYPSCWAARVELRTPEKKCARCGKSFEAALKRKITYSKNVPKPSGPNKPNDGRNCIPGKRHAVDA